MSRARDLACGLLAGALLSVARAPVGLDLLEVPVPSAWARYAFRAGALLALAAALGLGRRGELRPFSLLLGAALGFALAGLLLPAAWLPSALSELLLLLGLLAGATHILARRAGEESDAPQPRPFELLGILFAGAAAARALEVAASSVRLLGGGTAADDAVAATTFLLLAALGAAALGPLLEPGLRGHGAGALALILVLAAGAWGTHEAAELSNREALASALAQPARALGLVGLEVEPLGLSAFGTPGYSALLAAELFLPAAFALGLALSLLRDRRRVAAALAGAAVGLASPFAVPDWPFDFAAAGVLVLLGAVLGVRRRAPGAALAFGLAAALLASRVSGEPPARPFLSPWGPHVPSIEILSVTPNGLATVEHSPGGEPVATLHRLRLTPTTDELLHDARRIELSLELLGDAALARGPRVLFVGQMTEPRSRALAGAGALVDRTAPWVDGYRRLEDALFPGSFAPPGELLEPDEARARLAAGEYDLVLVPPIAGPVLPGLSPHFAEWAPADPLAVLPPTPPGDTIAVLWQDARAPLAGAPLGDGVLLSFSPNLRLLSVGIVLGAPGHAALLPAGDRRPQPPADLLATPMRRALSNGAAFGERLRRATSGTPREAFARGVALHLSAQAPSAPWDTPRSSVEIDPAAVAALRTDALTRAPDAATRDLWEALAAVLVEKRLPELLTGELAEVADAHAPWPVLDRAVARGFEELLKPDLARPYLERARAAEEHAGER